MSAVSVGSERRFRFRVLRGQSSVPDTERATWPESLPWAMVEPWRAQAERNHSQTLGGLHSRGGLAPEELWLAAHGLDLHHLGDITESAAGQWLIAIAIDDQTTGQP